MTDEEIMEAVEGYYADFSEWMKKRGYASKPSAAELVEWEIYKEHKIHPCEQRVQGCFSPDD